MEKKPTILFVSLIVSLFSFLPDTYCSDLVGYGEETKIDAELEHPEDKTKNEPKQSLREQRLSAEEIFEKAEQQDRPSSNVERIERATRVALLQLARVTQTLKIKPGMSIVDIGAGSGLFTFRFAEVLKGTGKVFATDIEPEMIEHLKQQAEENEYDNVFPILVDPRGVDPFYKQHLFDIIFISSTYEYLFSPEDYFRGLRPSLAKDTGRLYIIYFNSDPDFHQLEFDDFKQVINVLASKGEEFPVFQRLTQANQHFIRNWQGAGVPAEVQAALVADFNEILSDEFFFNDLVNYYYAKENISLIMDPLPVIHAIDFRLAKWLIVRLDQDGILQGRTKHLSETNKKQLRRLNRILLSGIFETQPLNEVAAPQPPIYFARENVITTLEAAGYRLVREYDFLVHYLFLEFKRED